MWGGVVQRRWYRIRGGVRSGHGDRGGEWEEDEERDDSCSVEAARSISVCEKGLSERQKDRKNGY